MWAANASTILRLHHPENVCFFLASWARGFSKKQGMQTNALFWVMVTTQSPVSYNFTVLPPDPQDLQS
ncbi:hypothetical protein COCSUDRAFT_33233 [Coccomyxa subellipsoidea C-169]|uniref:Uncharacterized protein n=1 Tax=Coccomyxa subellipsoidea (strain C-169) TaxID=574566 RepID=I0YXE8_COCSC|nr:hypothetical protein COCSUDRAFT_33233 [Coccomyxa subellipsoidea C-169]EIE23067.1 hypothetical protein COCSUDRAFT_33233 [Coccomyxa subellipsoidea C-169]|eukprot:XP_005647611.1 hypothetical protein COCSUDRAFT_33233 [Coccomyxa subellipsoidea C-169]